MSDDKLELSRRKILGSVGAVGAAGAAAGLGTSALFSDEESFENNSITAGTLDMKVDWEEHYSFPQLYGLGDPEDGLTTTRSDPSSLTNPVPFPPGVEADPDSDPILWVEGEDGNSDVGAYMDNTSIEAFPDTDGDGVQDFDTQDPPGEICSILTDVGLDEDGLSADDRTTNTATSDGDPLINLQDVKPGDFGEVTLSFHLCDNPGYVWLNAANVSAAENGTNEPEANESSDSGPADETTDSPTENDEIEILDEIETAWWYDEDCDNLTDAGDGGGSAEQVDIVFVFDFSGSMIGAGEERETLETQIPNLASNIQSQVDAQFAIVDYTDGAGVDQDLTSSSQDLVNAFADGPASEVSGSETDAGFEALSNAILFAAGEKVAGEGVSFRTNSKRIYVGISDENDQSSQDEKEDAATELNDTDSAFLGIGEDQSIPQNEFDYLLNNVDESSFQQFSGTNQSSFESALQSLIQFTGTVTGGEEIFYQDTLRNALDLLTSDGGIPLDGPIGDNGDDFDEANDPASADSRGCFETTPTTNCIGFSWWVPTDVGNQIQSDSVSFDLGFTTVQCRNSDGSFANAPDL